MFYLFICAKYEHGAVIFVAVIKVSDGHQKLSECNLMEIVLHRMMGRVILLVINTFFSVTKTSKSTSLKWQAKLPGNHLFMLF